MNYGNYTNYTFFIFLRFDFTFDIYQEKTCFFDFERILVFLMYFVEPIVILNIVFGFCVFLCIWEHTLNVCLNIFRPPNRHLFDPQIDIFFPEV